MSYYNGERIEDEFPEKQPIPSLNAGSLEEAAKEYGEKYTDFDAFDNKDNQLAGRLKAAFLAGAAYVKGGEEKGLSKEEIAQICEMADNDYAAQEAILFAEFLRKNNMGPNGFGGWGGGDINTNYYGSTEVKLYELFKKRPLASRPSLDIDKVVEQLREANPYKVLKGDYEPEKQWAAQGSWTECCDKLKEILNAPSKSPPTPIDREPEGIDGMENDSL